jgi:hypothetical protein
MNMLKLTAAAALVAASLSASAMTAIADQDLSAVAGQDGVSIAADLNINIGAFTYGDSGHTVSFNNITVRGLMDMTIDVIGATEFSTDVGTALATYGSTGGAATLTAVATALGYNGTADVVQFAFPAAAGAAAADAHLSTPTIKVGSITTGNGGASFGSITITNLDLQGTKVWMFGHN